MKILYYSPHPVISLNSPSGYATHMRETIHAMEELGHTVITVINGEQGGNSVPAHAASASKGKQFLKKLIPLLLWRSLKDLALVRFDDRSYHKLLEIVKREKPDLIYERGYYMMTSGTRAAIATGVKHCIEYNAPYIEETRSFSGYSLLTSYARKRDKFNFVNASLIVTVSSVLRDYFIREYRVDSKKFHVSPNCVNPASIKVDPGARSIIVEKCKITAPVVGFVGSIFPYHGVDLLINAFENVFDNYPKATLMIVGDGEILPQLKQYAGKLKSAGRIIFTGNVPHSEVFNYIDLFDIAVMARSNWYGSPVKIFEYGALGKPIIAPAVEPVKEVMKNGEEGLLVDPLTSQLALALDELLKHREAALKMGETFKKKVLENYTWRTSVAQMLKRVEER